MLQCLLHFARWPIQHSQILNCTLPNLQFHIVKITIFTSPLLHRKLDKFTLLYGLLKCFWTAPPTQNHGLPNLFLKFFLPKLCFLGPFSFGVSGGLAVVAYPPTSQPTYSLIYMLTYLGYLATYLLTQVQAPILTYLQFRISTSAQVCKYASLQVYKFANIKN